MKKVLVYFIFFIVVPLLLVELMARAYVYTNLDTGELMPLPFRYVGEAPSEAMFYNTQKNKKNCRWQDLLYPHPYLEYVYHSYPPCGNFIGDTLKENIPVNNAGMPSPYDLDGSKNGNFYNVLLTGGSVASGVGLYGIIKQGQTAPYIETELNKRYISPNGKPFRVINGGFGGWKYPNHFILFSLYAEQIDAVVTLDGYNEHHAFLDNPPVWFLEAPQRAFNIPTSGFSVVQPLTSQGINGIAGQAIAMNLQHTFENTSWLKHSSYAIALLFKGLINHFNAKSLESMQEGKLTQSISTTFDISNIVHNAEERYAVNILAYKKYLRMMDSIAKRLDVKNIHFIQPVPSLYKSLTEEEKSVVGDTGYAEMYKRISGDLMALRSEGVPMFSLMKIYENEPNTMYGDPVHCLWENQCYPILIDAMIADMAKSWKLKPKN